jgi:hypothetical protein
VNRREALAALTALPAIKSIAVADVKPRDVIVIESPGILSLAAVERITEYAREAWPNNKVVVLSDGLTVRVMREGS